MAISRLTLCDVLENEFVGVGLERDIDDNHKEYLKYLSEADAASHVLEEPSYLELRELHRKIQEEFDRQSAEFGEPTPATRLAYEDSEKQRLDRLMKILGTRERAALCLSGGGIRSATFSLGVIQGLAHRHLMRRFDYLSTVSGGGYIGSWLSAWLTHEKESLRSASPMSTVEQELRDPPQKKIDGENPKIEHLRSYSNYLSPQVGLLSADTWTLAATVLRNMFLNWLVLVPILAAVLLIPRLALAVVKAASYWPNLVLLTLVPAGFVCGVVAVSNISFCLPSLGGRQCSQAKFLRSVLLPLTLSAVFLSTFWAGWYLSFETLPPWIYCIFGAFMYWFGWLPISKVIPTAVRTYSQTGSYRSSAAEALRVCSRTWMIIFAPISGALGGCAAYLLAGLLLDPRNPELATCVAFPILFLLYFLTTSLFIGLASKRTDDDDREWWSRSSAWILIVMAGWLFMSVLVLLGPVIAHRFYAAAVGAGGLASGLLGSFGGLSAETSSGRDGTGKPDKVKMFSSEWFRNAALKLAPLVFLVCLLLLVSAGSHLLFSQDILPWVTSLKNWPSWLDEESMAVLGLISVNLAIAGVMSRYVDVNTFSLHAMYRNRLIRAYLGASNPQRAPNGFTGFDPADNLRMHTLSPGKPFHVINIALNLVEGKRLAWQQRKAESFTVSRLHSGSARIGYQRTRDYAGTDGIALGTAMAISGAAASPNMGYHSSPLLTFLMTFFNARLGWWLANPGIPGRKMWREPGPKSALKSLLGEALGQTDDQNEYVYLSDGGHFENLGLYEMVLRRCKIIVVVDGGADPNYEFEDLGNAIRKIRVDLGISIHLDKPIHMTAGPSETNVHCATAEISYGCVDPGATAGTLIYIKPVLDQMQSIDVDHYYASHKEFPQEPTADQFFDEAQFESYRRLGLESIDRICAVNGRNALLLSNFHSHAMQHRGTGSKAIGTGC